MDILKLDIGSDLGVVPTQCTCSCVVSVIASGVICITQTCLHVCNMQRFLKVLWQKMIFFNLLKT